MHVRKRVAIVILLLVVIIGIPEGWNFFSKTKYERAEERSIKDIEKLIDSHEQGELITTAKNPEQAAFAVQKRFGKYFTDEYADKVERKIRVAMKEDRDFEKHPIRITFFLVYTGDGIQFSKPEIKKIKTWQTRRKDNYIVGTTLWFLLHPDDPDWEDKDSALSNVKMVKDGWKYKIDAVE